MPDFNTSKFAPRLREIMLTLKKGQVEFEDLPEADRGEVLDFLMYLHGEAQPGPSMMHLKLFRELADRVETVVDIVGLLTGRGMEWTRLDRAMLFAWLAGQEANLEPVTFAHVLGRMPDDLRQSYERGAWKLGKALGAKDDEDADGEE